MLPAALTQPKSTDATFIGHAFKRAAHSWQIHEKTANKRGPVLWVQNHGSKLCQVKDPISRKAHWLCHRCWDRGVKKVLYTGSTKPAIEHMKDQHQWHRDGPIPTRKNLNCRPNPARRVGHFVLGQQDSDGLLSQAPMR